MAGEFEERKSFRCIRIRVVLQPSGAQVNEPRRLVSTLHCSPNPAAALRPIRSPPSSARLINTGALPAAKSDARESGNDLVQKVSAVAEFVRHRLTGDYPVDEFGFDPQFNNAIVRPLLRFFFNSWFRVEVSGIENLPRPGRRWWWPTMPACCRSTG